MRLWTVHPKYLDARGLVALWREALLAQKVLEGQTRGYRNHPQLARFRAQPEPLTHIARYLEGVHAESVQRGYAFDRSKIRHVATRRRLSETEGQLRYEWEHLKRKLRKRDRCAYRLLADVGRSDAHPLFRIVPGAVRAWEHQKERDGHVTR